MAKWRNSYKTFEYDTFDGFLHAGEFAVSSGVTYIFEDNTVRAWPDEDTRIASLDGFTQVNILGDAYYDRFDDSTLVKVTAKQYADLKDKKRIVGDK